ncbi:MAG TPA: MFS transporter, partial [Gemmatimonadaceae bacterium]|nr:MFS transporter [Gemmatimonadaceae bacterium]
MRPKLGRNVLGLGAVSFFTDASSEMIYPLLPVFLAGVLGANASFIGAIEGAAESTASLLRVISGAWSDRIGRRKPLVVAGYVIASLVRPFTALAQTATQVLSLRLTDRVGKGIRSAPRDALLADSISVEGRGRAFGFHAAADNAGAVLGPLVAFLILQAHGVTALDASVLRPTDEQAIRNVFWLSAIPAAIAVAILIFVVREVPHTAAGEKEAAMSAPPSAPDRLSRGFWGYLAVIVLFTLGNSTDAFLLLRAHQLGVPIALAPVLWALLNLVKAATGTYGGHLSDILGRKPLLASGWILYAAVYFGFGWATATWQAWALFAVYGIFYGMTEGTEKALVADLVPRARRGAAFGWYNLAIGLGA